MRENSTRLRVAVLLLVVVIACWVVPGRATAQIVEVPSEQRINTDSLKRAFADQHYYFGLYKDNYFIFGSTGQQKARQDQHKHKIPDIHRPEAYQVDIALGDIPLSVLYPEGVLECA